MCHAVVGVHVHCLTGAKRPDWCSYGCFCSLVTLMSQCQDAPEHCACAMSTVAGAIAHVMCDAWIHITRQCTCVICLLHSTSNSALSIVMLLTFKLTSSVTLLLDAALRRAC